MPIAVPSPLTPVMAEDFGIPVVNAINGLKVIRITSSGITAIGTNGSGDWSVNTGFTPLYANAGCAHIGFPAIHIVQTMDATAVVWRAFNFPAGSAMGGTFLNVTYIIIGAMP